MILIALIIPLIAQIAFGQSGKLEEMGSFLFQADKSDEFVDETLANRQLDELAAALRSRNLVPGSIRVHGYAAIADNGIYATGLAYNRAAFVMLELQKRGIAWEFFAYPVGYGAVNIFGNAAALNRRVTVNVLDIPYLGVPGVSGLPGTAAPGAAAGVTGPAGPGTTTFVTVESGTDGELLSRVEILDDKVETIAEKQESDRELIDSLIAYTRRPAGPGIFTSAFIGLGPEINGNTRRRNTVTNITGPNTNDFAKFAAGGYVIGAIEFMDILALGLRINFSYDFKTITTLEPALMIRYYMPLKGIFHGIFAEAYVGTASFYEYGSAYPAPLAALGAGWRFKIGKRFFIEPNVRGGMPFTFGAGLTAGYLFRN